MVNAECLFIHMYFLISLSLSACLHSHLSSVHFLWAVSLCNWFVITTCILRSLKLFYILRKSVLFYDKSSIFSTFIFVLWFLFFILYNIFFSFFKINFIIILCVCMWCMYIFTLCLGRGVAAWRPERGIGSLGILVSCLIQKIARLYMYSSVCVLKSKF